MDDFLRNFFVKMGLARTCEAFEAEWYELKATGRLEGSSMVPDVYLKNAVRHRCDKGDGGRGARACRRLESM
jgi:hypothetical protein